MTAGDRWFFELTAPVYDRLMWRADPNALQAGLDFATGRLDRILDLGGGTGRAVAALNEPTRIVMDPSQGMLRQVPAELAAVVATADRLPMHDGSVDAVLIVDALHHIPDRRAAVREVVRVLRDGGVVVIRDFDPTTRRGRLVEFGEHMIGMLSSFRGPESVARLLEGMGLEASITDRGFTYTVAGRVPKTGNSKTETTN